VVVRKEIMKVIIAGSRQIKDPIHLRRALDFYTSPIAYPDPTTCPIITEVVCGEARGADTLGKEWAMRKGIPVKSFPADWDKYGKRAGYLRNIDMAEYADQLIALLFLRGGLVGTRGTANMIHLMQNMDKPTTICYIYPEQLTDIDKK
jgi:hypothetical protein